MRTSAVSFAMLLACTARNLDAGDKRTTRSNNQSYYTILFLEIVDVASGIRADAEIVDPGPVH